MEFSDEHFISQVFIEFRLHVYVSSYGSLSSSLTTKNFFIFAIRPLTLVCSSLFASKYNIILSNAYSLCTRTEASFQTFPFHANTRHELMLYLFFVANMVNINLGMEVLNIFNSCMDTSGPFVIPFIASLQDIVGIDWKLNIQTRINSYPSCSP